MELLSEEPLRTPDALFLQAARPGRDRRTSEAAAALIDLNGRLGSAIVPALFGVCYSPALPSGPMAGAMIGCPITSGIEL